ncbi:MAG: hypothetical protein KC776_38005 [Myxococcales bacterium]|nr:hypothetical protein [Myxococcales bacterium]
MRLSATGSDRDAANLDATVSLPATGSDRDAVSLEATVSLPATLSTTGSAS